MADYVFATQNIALRDEEGNVKFLKRNTPWAADDPLVKLHPGFFTAEPIALHRSVPEPPKVEAATKAPGERR